MKEQQNTEQVVALQPDMIGIVFYKKSPRYCHGPSPEVSGVKKVGVFVDAPLEEMIGTGKLHNLSSLQLHGHESPETCRELQKEGYEVLKAFAIDANFNFASTEPYAESCNFFVFDARGVQPGGNGVAYDWSLLKKYVGAVPFLLSGGIDLSAVFRIKQLNHPRMAGVDINSRFESSPGVKDVEKVKNFRDELFG